MHVYLLISLMTRVAGAIPSFEKSIPRTSPFSTRVSDNVDRKSDVSITEVLLILLLRMVYFHSAFPCGNIPCIKEDDNVWNLQVVVAV